MGLSKIIDILKSIATKLGIDVSDLNKNIDVLQEIDGEIPSGGYVKDVQIAGESKVVDGVANIPYSVPIIRHIDTIRWLSVALSTVEDTYIDMTSKQSLNAVSCIEISFGFQFDVETTERTPFEIVMVQNDGTIVTLTSDLSKFFIDNNLKSGSASIWLDVLPVGSDAGAYILGRTGLITYQEGGVWKYKNYTFSISNILNGKCNPKTIKYFGLNTCENLFAVNSYIYYYYA